MLPLNALVIFKLGSKILKKRKLDWLFFYLILLAALKIATLSFLNTKVKRRSLLNLFIDAGSRITMYETSHSFMAVIKEAKWCI